MKYKYEIVHYDNDLPAKVMYLNLSSATHKTELHCHKEPEIVYVTNGIAECQKDGEKFLLFPGQFMFFNSEEVHIVAPKKGNSTNIIIVQLSYEYMRLFNTSIDEVTFFTNKSQLAQEQLSMVLDQLANINHKKDNYERLLLASIVNKICYILFTYCIEKKANSGVATTSNAELAYTKIAIAYINENFRNKITLPELSKLVNLSPSYFSKYFKSVTQVNFTEYLANLRLEYALHDVTLNNVNVSDAAKQNGFANVKAFITQCKKVYGYTPAQYKKHILSK